MLNRIFDKFCSEINQKYNTNISISAEDDDTILINFNFNI